MCCRRRCKSQRASFCAFGVTRFDEKLEEDSREIKRRTRCGLRGTHVGFAWWLPGGFLVLVAVLSVPLAAIFLGVGQSAGQSGHARMPVPGFTSQRFTSQMWHPKQRFSVFRRGCLLGWEGGESLKRARREARLPANCPASRVFAKPPSQPPLNFPQFLSNHDDSASRGGRTGSTRRHDACLRGRCTSNLF